MLDKEIEEYSKNIQKNVLQYSYSEKFLKIIHIGLNEILALFTNNKIFVFNIKTKEYIHLFNIIPVYDNKKFKKCKKCKFYSICKNKTIPKYNFEHMGTSLEKINEKLLNDEEYGCIMIRRK